MDTSTPKTNKILFIVCGVAFALPFLVFAQFTVRLAYRWMTVTEPGNGSVWTVVWAITFPLGTVIFGFISWFFINKARKGFSRNRER